jgi:hypothetical protein
MGTWRVPADLLARSRFAVSPLNETVAALTVLERPKSPWQNVFAAAHRDAYLAMLAAHPTRAALVDWSWRPKAGDRPGWIADFLGAPPLPGAPGFDAELADLAARWDDAAIRAELRGLRADRLPAVLARPGLREALVGLLGWVWGATVEADWPRRERVLRADVVSRTSRLADRGWSAVIADLQHHGPRCPHRSAAGVGRQPPARAAGVRVRAAPALRARGAVLAHRARRRALLDRRGRRAAQPTPVSPSPYAGRRDRARRPAASRRPTR